ncbi:hypothetical protein HU200_016966 [Digitaria exilis]|uniref:Uncharacterized protein n=1 Tax=Digitaria exilis TaxID=1010633 RepID=A0A835F747_9POAL|nr:hypothetical protein HU200_016966 [Digitaria exilis]
MLKKIDYHLSMSKRDRQRCGSCVILRIKQHIRDHDKRAYDPIIFSIGPYHHGSPGLQATEKNKWYYLDYILQCNSRSLEDYLSVIVSLEHRVRDSYTDEIKMEDSELFRMLLRDSCFLLVKICGKGLEPHAYKLDSSDKPFTGLENESDNESRKHECAKGSGSTEIEQADVNAAQGSRGQAEDGKWYYSCASHDLLLLENQIPFFVLREIYQIFVGQEETTITLAESTFRFVEGMMQYYPKPSLSDRPTKFHHLLHLCHMFFRPSQKQLKNSQRRRKSKWFGLFLPFDHRYLKVGNLVKENTQEISNEQRNILKSRKKAIRWRRAMHYYEAGIEFKRKEIDEDNPHSLLDISFSDGVLEIPQLPIDQNTGSLFRNFVALELTDPRFGNDFTAYVSFISQLICISSDVAMLSKRGIIVHEMRSDEDASGMLDDGGVLSKPSEPVDSVVAAQPLKQSMVGYSSACWKCRASLYNFAVTVCLIGVCKSGSRQ